MKKLAILVLLLVPGAPGFTGSPPAVPDVASRNDALHQQSIARLLEQRFPQQDVSYLLLDAKTGSLISVRWPGLAQPVPMGSLLKPFTALAYGEAHSFRYPEYVCRGQAGGCWRPRGHGRVGITEAIAHSCNAYFRALAAQVPAENLAALLGRYGVNVRDTSDVASAKIGVGRDWKSSPLEMARAYLALASRSHDPGAKDLTAGMLLSARLGTGSAVDGALSGSRARVKTGTAPCVHLHRLPGDGYAVVLYPAEPPRFLLLVQVHGVPGSRAAVTAGSMLRVVLDGN
ncbi:MAG: penicillin-binding transpeptidase domain-containing protein [Terriglobales bacterium]